MVAGSCLLLFLLYRGCGSSEFEERLVGKWELTDGEKQGTTVEFTEGGKLLVHGPGESSVGVYSVRGSTLSVREGDTSGMFASQYDMEFNGDSELILAKTEDGLDFDSLDGRWRQFASSTEETIQSDTPATTTQQPKLVGKWSVTRNGKEKAHIEFTSGGKALVTELDYDDFTVAMYSVGGNRLSLWWTDDPKSTAAEYELEFFNDNEVIVALMEHGKHVMDDYDGRWQRIGSPPTAPSRNPALASLDAKRKALEQRRAQIGTLIEKAEEDKQRVVARLRAMGATSAKSIPNTSEARRLVAELQRLSREIASLQRDALTLDEAIAKAGSLARRLERSQIAITDEELGGLSVDLRSASDDSPRTTTPIELETLLDDELSGK